MRLCLFLVRCCHSIPLWNFAGLSQSNSGLGERQRRTGCIICCSCCSDGGKSHKRIFFTWHFFHLACSFTFISAQFLVERKIVHVLCRYWGWYSPAVWCQAYVMNNLSTRGTLMTTTMTTRKRFPLPYHTSVPYFTIPVVLPWDTSHANAFLLLDTLCWRTIKLPMVLVLQLLSF